MQIIISADYDEQARRAAADITALLQIKERSLLCPASGDTPKGIFRELVQLQQHKGINLQQQSYVGLDEWMGMNAADEGSCRNSLDRDFFHPAGIPENNICFFDGKAENPEQECERIETFIGQNSGIDIVILGLGLNGHVGMNEPGTPATLRSHVSTLDPLTAATGQKYFNKPTPLTKGLTLGIASLLAAKHIFLVVNGSKKAAIVQQVISSAATETIPATMLKEHPGFRIYLDREAASELKL